MTDDVEKIFNQRENAAQMPDANYTRTKAGNLYYVSAGSPVGLRVSEEPSEVPGAEAVQTGLDTSASFDYLMQKAEQDVAQDTDVMTVDRMIATPEIVYDAMQIYEMFEGQPFRGGADDVIDYALNVQSDFMFNIGGIPGVGTDAGGTIAQAAHILSQEDPDKAQAFLDFMGAYEQLPTFTSAGVSRAFRSIFTDPTTYAGIVSAGAGLFARQTTQTGIKLGIKQALQQMARPAQFATQRPVAAGALAGAGYSEVGEVGQMAVETAAGEAPTPLEAGIRATVAPAIGATVGAGLAKGAQTVLPPVGQAIGDLFEGMGEGAKKRMSESGTTLTSGVDPDPLIAAAGDAVAKFRAPTEKQPGVIAFHGSGADFDEFKLEKIGTGEGAQAYGYGLYFAEKEDIAKFYRDTIASRDAMHGQLPIRYKGKKFAEFEDSAAAEAEPDKYRMLTTLGKEIHRLSYSPKLRTPENAKKQLLARLENEIAQQRNLFKNESADVKDAMEEALIASLQRDVDALEQINPADVTIEKTGKMYKVGLEPKPEDMLDYDLTIGDQSPDIKAKISKLVDNEITPDDLENFGSPRGDLKASLLSENRTVASFLNDFAAVRGKDNAGEELLAKYGIPGIKYFDNTSRNTAGGELIDVTQAEDGFRAKVAVDNRPGGLGGSGRIVTTSAPYKTRQEALDWADEETKKSGRNYVIFDDKMIKILEKYGIVGPVAITGVAASQQEGESANVDT